MPGEDAEMKGPSFLLLKLAMPAFLATLCCQGAPVAPNPLSLLKDKRILLIDPTDPTDYHKQPRIILTGKLNRIQSAVGFRMTSIKGVDTMTLPALNRYDIVIFNYYMKLELLENKPFGIAFKQWLAEGHHGVVAYHNSGSQSLGQWNWYRDSVQSMRYIDHKDQAQKGTVNITTDTSLRKLPILEGMDAKFTGVDEWYSFDMPPKAPAAPTWPECRVLYYMDENSVAQLTDKMGVHPTTWIREDAKKNRYFYTLHIHSDDGANSDFFHSLIQRAMEYVAGYQDPVTMNGAPVERADNLAFITSGRQVNVSMNGEFQLSIRSAAGATLFSQTGKGRQTYAPQAFARSGIYYLTVEAKSRRITQRLMIY
jgi:Trehalose utilisation